MNELLEAKKALESVLTADQRKDYYEHLKKWTSYASPLTKLQFDSKIRQILQTPEQQQIHNKFLCAFLYSSLATNTEENRVLFSGSKELFEAAPASDSAPTIIPSVMPGDVEHRTAAAELFVPDSGFLSTKIAAYAWENGLEGAEDNVTQIVMHACQVFIQNIITAMVSRKMGYKIRNGKFQHGFGVPVPDPYLRNSNYIIDDTQECKADVSNEEDCFVPAYRPTLDTAEDQTIFARACAKDKLNLSDKTLDIELLYHTLREDPSIVGLNSVHSLHMLRSGFALEDD